MSLRIIDRHRGVGIDRRSIRRLASLILGEHGRSDADVTVVFATDGFVRDLNRDYRGVDRATDVLAFAMEEGGDEGSAPSDEGVEQVLGDVVVSLDRAVVQARRYRRSVEHEVLKLVAHGVLHLLGRDHARASERRAMRKLENRYVRETRAARPSRGAGGAHGRREGAK